MKEHDVPLGSLRRLLDNREPGRTRAQVVAAAHLPAAYNIRHLQRHGMAASAWGTRHLAGLTEALEDRTGSLWGSIARGIDAWIDQAKSYRRRFDSGIGEDYYVAPLWYRQGEALRGMLNLDMGPLDCGSLDAVIRETLLAEGWKES